MIEHGSNNLTNISTPSHSPNQRIPEKHATILAYFVGGLTKVSYPGSADDLDAEK
jgi:hypothetical protein